MFCVLIYRTVKVSFHVSEIYVYTFNLVHQAKCWTMLLWFRELTEKSIELASLAPGSLPNYYDR